MKRLILFITLLLSINFVYGQRVLDGDEVIVRDSLNLNGDWFSINNATDYQLMQRLDGRWVNKTISGIADIQRIVESINREWEVKHAEAWDSSDLVGVQYFLSKGGTIIGLDSKESTRWRQAVAPVANEYVADMKKKGFSDAQKYVDFVKSSLERYGK